MFTGIVAAVGRIQDIRRGGTCDRFSIEAPSLCPEMSLGDSISVVGVCLTVTDKTEATFLVDASPETQRRTKLNRLRAGDRVNLELALRVGDRLGGHFVLGHIDGVGKISKVSGTTESEEVDIWYDGPEGHLVVAKGSVAVDGVSLTVARVKSCEFTVSLIPHTLRHTTLQDLRSGSEVNIEVDVIGRYVAAALKGSDRKDLSKLLHEAWGSMG